MAATLSFAGGYNGYLPEVSGQVVGYILKEADFAFKDYVQLVPTNKNQGVFTRLDRDQPVRRNASITNVWKDGDYRPSGENNAVRFIEDRYRCERYYYGWRLGYQAIDMTDFFELKPVHMDNAISQALLDLSARIVTILEASASWASGNVVAANTLNEGAGMWDTASNDQNSPNYLAIFRTLQGAARIIDLQTNGKISPNDLVTVINPDAARILARTPEIQDYCRSSPEAKEILSRGLDPQWTMYGLPRSYRGYKFVVERAVQVTGNPAADGTEATLTDNGGTRGYLKAKTSAAMISRPGGISGGVPGAPSYSTLQVWHEGPLTQVEAFDEPKHRLVEGGVTVNTAEKVSSTVSGVLISNVLPA